MKKVRRIVAFLFAVGFVFCSTIAVYAADPYIDYGSETGNVTVKSYSSSYNDVWVGIIDNGIAAWNDSSANVSISTSSSSSNTIEAARYNDTWYGLTTQAYYTSTAGLFHEAPQTIVFIIGIL